MRRDRIHTDSAPKALGPYSQAIRAGDWVFTAGQLGIDPATGQLQEGVAAQTTQALRNLDEVLRAAGASLGTVVKSTIFLADMNDFAAVNEVYGSFFTDAPPARSTVQVARLPMDGRVEIEVVALLTDYLMDNQQ